MFNLIGPVCYVCKKSINDVTFNKDQSGDPLYFTNPKICEYTDEVHYFCGPICSTKWWTIQMEARKDVPK